MGLYNSGGAPDARAMPEVGGMATVQDDGRERRLRRRNRQPDNQASRTACLRSWFTASVRF